ncbi:hypothetical protein RHRU231_920017 [Rhodococcus ruber]|uniref:Uncharacterized protein n=1 Tax=Rhodococcus ruber TaxID=1830 RepID=A0A098BTK8_9NOCA|nr:hypothetical protein RHRU231_920017 [Rhodococcus ruber]
MSCPLGIAAAGPESQLPVMRAMVSRIGCNGRTGPTHVPAGDFYHKCSPHDTGRRAVTSVKHGIDGRATPAQYGLYPTQTPHPHGAH